MILLYISSPDLDELHSMAKALLVEKLVADIRIDSIRRLTIEQDQLIEIPRYILACKTKALLFNPIVEFLRLRKPNQLPEIYALPLVCVEKSQEDIIRNRTKAV
jgi:uncharacterized protein involved in tolerance to divalent cations